MSLSLASITSFASRGTSDILGTVFSLMNTEIETAINAGNTDVSHLFERYFNSLPETHFNRYMAEGSYYPALTLPMRKGDFQKVNNVLEVLKNYPKFQTPTIRLCHAACLHKIGKKEECLAVLKTCTDFNVRDLLDELARSKRVYEKTAFIELRDNVPAPESP